MHDPNFPPHLSINPSSNPFPSLDRDESNGGFIFSSQDSAIQKYGIAGRIWEASYTLMTYFQNKYEFDPPSPFLDVSKEPFTILELGSGTGIVSANLSYILRRKDDMIRPWNMIIATDLENVCPLLRKNMNNSFSPVKTGAEPRVRPLHWGDENNAQAIFEELSQNNRTLSHIICSDLVYFPELLAPLLRTLIHLTSSPCNDGNTRSGPTIIISYRIRSLPKESLFWQAFGLWFDWEPVLYRDQTLLVHQLPVPINRRSEWTRYDKASSTYLFIAHRKTFSHSWSIPQNDLDLLDGVGAQGNNLRKADEAFEMMLLMDLVDIE